MPIVVPPSIHPHILLPTSFLPTSFKMMTFTDLATLLSIIGYELDDVKSKLKRTTDAAQQKELLESQQRLQKEYNRLYGLFEDREYIDDAEEDEDDDYGEHYLEVRAKEAIDACYDI